MPHRGADPDIQDFPSKVMCSYFQVHSHKETMANETGFGGLLELKITQKTNLKLSAVLMQRVDPDTSSIVMEHNRVIPITDEDVYNAFGIPQGLIAIPAGSTDLTDACIEFSRLASAISAKGIHSLKGAEDILKKPIDENSTKIDMDCFKIAYVVFSVGHVPNPSTKHDYTSITAVHFSHLGITAVHFSHFTGGWIVRLHA